MNSCTSSDLRGWKHAVAVALTAVFVVACQQQDRAQGEPQETATAESAMNWARDALQRNPNLELVATDATTQVFTVRDKQTGEVRAVKLSELAAAPVSALAARTSAPAQPAAAASTASESTSASTAGQTSTEEARPATAPTQSPEAAGRTAQPAPDSAAESANAPGYTIERSGGQVRVSGPGVSIVSSGGADTETMAAQQNAAEPIICEGERMVHFDNRQIYVEGDAITVRGGCEMYITNSRIIATGTGIVVQDGTVHVSNSHIEGVENSFDADSRAKVFVRASTFKGLPQRSELALVQDQGGNRWR